MPTELVWDGKYKDGKKASPLRISLPFQDVETVNESAQERQKMLDLFSLGRPTDWRNRLIWGDKRYVLPSLLNEFAGKVDLVYIDPPFATGADFSFTTLIPDSDQSFTKEPSSPSRPKWTVSACLLGPTPSRRQTVANWQLGASKRATGNGRPPSRRRSQ